MLWNNVICKEEVGNIKRRSSVKQSTQHDLVITNTLFRKKNMCKTTWMHPRSKHGHLLDYVIVHACYQNDVRIARATQRRNSCIFNRSSPGAIDCEHLLCTQNVVNVQQGQPKRSTTSNPYGKHQDLFDVNDMEIPDLLDCKKNTFCLWQNYITSQQIHREYQRVKAVTQYNIKY